jgi:hypothetical protein
MDPATMAATDDFRGLVDRLRLPAAVAAVRYASGARIRRVTVTRGVQHVRGGNGDRPVIILSRKMLKAIRAETSRAPAA